MACDLRLAGKSARLSDWHLKVTGLGLGQWGGAARLCRLVGVDKAKELLLTGEELDAEEARHIGLVNRVVDDHDLQQAAIHMACTIAGMPRRGVRTTLGFLGLQEDMTKRDAIHWAKLTPELMGLELRPFRETAARFYRDRDQEELGDEL
jgi:enoyl-CoA hydratase